MEKRQDSGLKKEIGLTAATAIVIGNMIGSGIFMAPNGLARISNPKASILAWVITAIGSILLAMSFAKMGTAMPRTGGPIEYSRAAFGDFAGFLIAWSYWIGAWVGNAAIITGFMTYFSYFFPALNSNHFMAFLVCTAVLWIFTYINIIGVKGAGLVGIITTILKILPLLVFAIIAAIHFNPSIMGTVTSKDVSGMSTLPPAIAITLWAFIGLESATIPAEEIKNPEKNIRRSTLYGIVITSVIYLLISVLAMGCMSQAELAKSTSPLADIINSVTHGNWGGNFIALGAVISTLGATSGWILTTARSAYSASTNRLFPTVFKKVHPKYRTPHMSLIISGIAANIILVLCYEGSLTWAYNLMINLATLAFLPAYTFTAAAEMLLLFKHSPNFNLLSFIKNSFFALLAFIYSIYAIYGTGATVVMYGFLLILIGLPFYVYMKLQNNYKSPILK